MHDTKGTWLSSIITAVANFSTQYNFQCISVVLLIMSSSQCTSNDEDCKEGDQAVWVQSTASAAVFLGAIVGQLTMGYLGDYFSRNFALCWTLVLAGFSAVLCAVASTGSPESTYSVIILFRFLLGVGLGGVFPLAAAKASEDHAVEDDVSHKNKIDSSASAWSFFWQMPGLFLPWFFGYVFSESNDLTTMNRWKIILGLGSLPCFLAAGLLLLEAYLEGSSLFIAQKSQTSNDIPLTHVLQLLSDRDNLRKLLVAGGCWFLFDIVVYGIGLITGTIIEDISNDDDNVSNRENIENTSSKQMIASSVTIVVCAISITLIPRLGLQQLQIIAFCIVAFFCILLSSLFQYLNHYNKNALFIVYVITYSSLNFGLGATSYSMPASLFPKEIRGTFSGIAAACGKLGAAVGAFTFKYIAQSDAGYSGLLGICAFIALVSAVITMTCVSAKDFLDFQSSEREKSSVKERLLP